MPEKPLNDADLLPFAASCARSYCRRFNCWPQLEDATQEVALFLLSRRDKWNAPRAALRRRAVGVLIRAYQDERRLRTKSPLVILPSAELEKVDNRRPEKEVDERIDSGVAGDPRLEIIQRALRQPDVAPYAGVIREILDGTRPRKEIAAAAGISQGRLSQVFSTFKRICRQFELRNGSAAVLVDTLKEDPTPEERAQNPLFYQ